MRRKKKGFLILAVMPLFFVPILSFSTSWEDSFFSKRAHMESYISYKAPYKSLEEIRNLVDLILEKAPLLEIPEDWKIDGEPIDKELFLTALIYVESWFSPRAVSSKGALGYMQLMLPTAKWIIKEYRLPYSVREIFKPEVNIEMGIYYLNYLFSRFSSLEEVLIAYNAGPSRVKDLPKDYIYVRKILKAYRELQGL